MYSHDKPSAKLNHLELKHLVLFMKSKKITVALLLVDLEVSVFSVALVKSVAYLCYLSVPFFRWW